MGIDLARLAEPFTADDLEWRMLQGGIKNGKPWGKCVAYVTNRAIMERLDEVCGPENWSNRFEAGPGGGVVCGISVRIVREDGSADWVTKWDGAENTDIEQVKGGISGAMKRAAVQWGCGRYLYDLPEGWASFDEGGPLSAKIEGTWYRWTPPSLPAWALPKPRRDAGRNKPSPRARGAAEAKPGASAALTLGGAGRFRDTLLTNVPDEVLIEARDALTEAAAKAPLKQAHAEKLAAIQAVLADRDRAAAEAQATP